jgi:hypothetical protein
MFHQNVVAVDPSAFMSNIFCTKVDVSLKGIVEGV